MHWQGIVVIDPKQGSGLPLLAAWLAVASMVSSIGCRPQPHRRSTELLEQAKAWYQGHKQVLSEVVASQAPLDSEPQPPDATVRVPIDTKGHQNWVLVDGSEIDLDPPSKLTFVLGNTLANDVIQGIRLGSVPIRYWEAPDEFQHDLEMTRAIPYWVVLRVVELDPVRLVDKSQETPSSQGPMAVPKPETDASYTGGTARADVFVIDPSQRRVLAARRFDESLSSYSFKYEVSDGRGVDMDTEGQGNNAVAQQMGLSLVQWLTSLSDAKEADRQGGKL